MFSHDLRQALRVFYRSPGIALAVVFTLAISIGAVTTVLGIANSILFRPLPYPEADRLLVVDNDFTGFSNAASYMDIQDWKRDSTAFEKMAEIVTWSTVNLTDGDVTSRVNANYVGGEFFDLVGARPYKGRVFSAEESSVPDTAPVAVMSHSLWTNRYGGEDMVGQTILIQGQPITVVGILPRDFENISDDVHLWMPITMMSVLLRPDALNTRGIRLMHLLVRVKDGVTQEQVQAEMDALTANQQETFPDSNEGYGAHVRTLFYYIYYEQQGIEDIRRSTLFLGLGSIFLLLLTCVNLGSLFMVRAIRRNQEFAVRLAIGIKRWQLIRLLMLESFLLTFVGGVLALLIASVSQAYLIDLGNIDLPDFIDLGIDGTVLFATIILCTLAALLFSLLPALRATDPDLRSVLQSGDHRSGGGGGKAAGALVVAEVALAVVLLIGAGLMMRSFEALRSTSIGFDEEGLLTIRARLTGQHYSGGEERINLGRRFSEVLKSLPGVQSAGIWSANRPGESGGYLDLVADGKTIERPEDVFRARNHHLVPGALQTVGIPILRGRDITEADTSETTMVALVAEGTAKALFPGQDPLGKIFRVGSPTGLPLEVIGVVPDIRHAGRIGDEQHGDIYLSYYQRPVRALSFFVKTEQDPEVLAPTLSRLMRTLDPELAVFGVETVRQRMEEEEAPLRMTAILMGFYSAIAVILACLGIYSVLAYSVNRRTHEIGVRLAFGAMGNEILWMLLRRALILVGIGLVVGLVLAFFLTRTIQSILFGISSTDPIVYLLVPLGTFLLAFLASWIPTRRALRIEPVAALRYE